MESDSVGVLVDSHLWVEFLSLFEPYFIAASSAGLDSSAPRLLANPPVQRTRER